MGLVGAKICSELTYNEWVERKKERRKERKKERRKERKKYYHPLHIFCVVLQRMALFWAKTCSELTYNEWIERGQTKKERNKEQILPSFMYIFAFLS